MTTLSTQLLRPGLLVSLKTSLKGNVSYSSIEIEAAHKVKGGAVKAKWETEKTVVDPAEHEAGIKARAKVRNTIVSACVHSAFGLLCPEADADKLAKAIDEGRKVAAEFNASASLTRLTVNVLSGRIAADDVEAVKSINSEVRDLLGRMQEGVRNLDVKVIREAANEAKALGQMLLPDAQARVQIAIDAVRKTARAISKAGEDASAEIDNSAIRAITEARTAFLDLDEAAEIGTPKETVLEVEAA